jgi:hypothetical protein
VHARPRSLSHGLTSVLAACAAPYLRDLCVSDNFLFVSMVWQQPVVHERDSTPQFEYSLVSQ